MNRKQWRTIVLTILLACDSGTAPATPLQPTDLSGTYRITFVRAPNQNPNFTCREVSLNLGAGTWTPVTCGVAPATPAIRVRNDSLVLEVVTAPGDRDIILWEFTGSVDNVSARWVGATCTDLPSVPDACMRESGTATLQRPAGSF